MIRSGDAKKNDNHTSKLERNQVPRNSLPCRNVDQKRRLTYVDRREREQKRYLPSSFLCRRWLRICKALLFLSMLARSNISLYHAVIVDLVLGARSTFCQSACAARVN